MLFRSGKKLGTRVSPDKVLYVFVVVVLFFALLLSYPWEVLSIGTIIYLASLPFGWMSYRDQARKHAEALPAASAPAATDPPDGAQTPADDLHPPQGPPDERLN